MSHLWCRCRSIPSLLAGRLNPSRSPSLRTPLLMFVLLVSTGCASSSTSRTLLLVGGEASPQLILPGDKITLRVFDEPELGGEFVVDQRGSLVLPRLGSVDVGHVPVLDLPDSLRARFAEYIRTPAVEVNVLRRIGVHGEVVVATLYWLDMTMTLRDAVALAGGVTEQGDISRVFLVRGEEQLRVGSAGSAALLGVGLRSGDQIVVGRRSWVSLNAPFLISAAVSVLSVVSGVLIAR